MWKILFFVVLLLLGVSFWFADVFPFRAPPPTYARDYRYFGVEDAQGNQIACRFLSNQSSRYLIIYSHGSSEDLGMIEPLLKGLRHVGVSVLAYDYPGYGLSGGKSTEEGCYDALDAVISFAHNQLGFPMDKIILQGRSLGAGPSVEMCRRKNLGGLILESAYFSSFSVTLGFRGLPWDPFNNLGKITKVDESVIVIHGVQDSVVPFRHGELLFEKLESPKLHYWVEDAGHNDIISVLGDEYWAIIRDFIRYLDAE